MSNSFASSARKLHKLIESKTMSTRVIAVLSFVIGILGVPVQSCTLVLYFGLKSQ
jgi:hypothetical protein